MSQEARIKEEIGWYKIIFAIFVAADLSLLAWFAQNFNQKETFILFLCSISIVFITTIVAIINRKVFKSLDRLEKL